ncbi:MAG: Ca2+/Na+ antiporter [Planctomycetaceae bacterium]|jgi:Ca2+/Na+ antiporter
MLLAMFSINYAGIIGSLIAAVLLIVGLVFGFRLMKVSHAPAWAIGCVAILGAIFLGRGGGVSEIMLLVGVGTPLLGAAVYLAVNVRLSSPKQVRTVAAVVIFAFVFLVLLKSGFNLGLETQEQALQRRTNESLMDEQAARFRLLREDYDRQRREIFDAGITRSSSGDESASESASGSSSGEDQLQTLKSSSGVAWYPEVDERFGADIQPSMAATGQALGKKLIPLIKSVRRDERDPPVIDISATRTGPREDLRQVMTELATVMRGRYPEATVMVDRTTYVGEPNTLYIRLTMSVVQMLAPAPWDKAKSELLADVTAEVGGTNFNKASVSVRFVDKPWIHDFDQFVSSNRDSGLLVDGRSGRLATSRAEAHDAAIDDAVSLLTPIATEVLKAQKHLLIRTPDEEDIAARLKQELLAGQLVDDTFSQQLTHPMGNLWREAVLVRVDYPWLERVFSNYLRQRQDEQRGRLSLGAALTLLVIGIVVLHGLLNWITKGYHRKSVGMLSALFAVVGVLGVVIVALRLSGLGHL